MTWDNPQPIDPRDQSRCHYCGEELGDNVHTPQFAWRDQVAQPERFELSGPCIEEPFEAAQKRIVERINATTPSLDQIRFESETTDDDAWVSIFDLRKPEGIEMLNGQDPVMYALHQMFDRVVTGYAKACVDAGRVLTFGEYDGSMSIDDEWPHTMC